MAVKMVEIIFTESTISADDRKSVAAEMGKKKVSAKYPPVPSHVRLRKGK